MADRRPFPFVVIVTLLLIAGGVLFVSVQRLSAELAPGAGLSSLTAIHDAAAAGDAAALRAELSAGADPDTPTGSTNRYLDGLTPIMLALEHDSLASVKVLIEGGADVNARSTVGQTPLILAAGWAGAESVQALVDAGARLDARNSDGWTATIMAAGRGKLETLQELINAGANVDARNKHGQTALMLASYSGSPEKLRSILDAGANLDIRDNNGLTALSVLSAATSADADAMRLLLVAGANPNASDNDGVTVLMKAAELGDLEKVQALLEVGAQTHLRDTEGRNAPDWARSRDDEIGERIATIIETHAD